MKTFISWSKPLSQSIAESFSLWLPKVIQECRDPYVSSETDKGEAWFQTITTQLRESKVGIVFITPQNLAEEWIHLEAGAIYAVLEKKLCPVLVNLRKTDYDGPLRNIQMTELGDKRDMLRLMHTLNKNCDSPLEDTVLGESFERWWPDLEAVVQRTINDNPDSAPTPKRSESDKVDEILLLVRNLNVRSASAPDPKMSNEVLRRRRQRANEAEGMSEFTATYPGRYVLENGVVVGEVTSARIVDGKLLVQITPPNSDSPGAPFEQWIADPAELELSSTPF